MYAKGPFQSAQNVVSMRAKSQPEQQRNELEKLKQLRLQVRQQQAEIDFLKKAAAYFAKLPK